MTCWAGKHNIRLRIRYGVIDFSEEKWCHGGACLRIRSQLGCWFLLVLRVFLPPYASNVHQSVHDLWKHVAATVGIVWHCVGDAMVAVVCMLLCLHVPVLLSTLLCEFLFLGSLCLIRCLRNPCCALDLKSDRTFIKEVMGIRTTVPIAVVVV